MEFGSVMQDYHIEQHLNGEFSDTNNVNNIVSGEPLRYITPFAGVNKGNLCWLTLILINPIL